MKRLAIILGAALMLLLSCTKEDAKKTYTFVEYTEGYKYLEEIAQGKFDIGYTFFINEYTESGLKVKSNAIDKPQQGKKYYFTATEDTQYLTVKWQYSIDDDVEIRYMTNAFLLKEGQDILIEVNEDTYFQKSEPKN